MPQCGTPSNPRGDKPQLLEELEAQRLTHLRQSVTAHYGDRRRAAETARWYREFAARLKGEQK